MGTYKATYRFSDLPVLDTSEVIIDQVYFIARPLAEVDMAKVRAGDKDNPCEIDCIFTAEKKPEPYFVAESAISRFLDLMLLAPRGRDTEELGSPDLSELKRIITEEGDPSIILTNRPGPGHAKTIYGVKGIEDLAYLFEKVHRSSHEELVFHILDQLRVVLSVDNAYAMFAIAWASLDRLYTYVCEEESPQKSIESFAGRVFRSESEAELFLIPDVKSEGERSRNAAAQNLSRRDLVLRKRTGEIKMKCSEDLRKAIEGRAYREAVGLTLLCLYSVRNDIVHGRLISKKMGIQVKMYAIYLSDVIKYCLRKLIDGEISMYMSNESESTSRSISQMIL
jgi:hypothetical protein